MPIQRHNYLDEPLGDGMLECGKMDQPRDAQKRLIGAPVFLPMGEPLWFKEMELRQQDFDFYEGRLQSESLKVKTNLVPGDKSLKIRVNGKIYDVVQTDKDGRYRYWYLSRVDA